MLLRRFILPLGLALLASAAMGHSYKLGLIEIGHPWMTPVTDGTGIVNMALANNGPEPDYLIGAATPTGTAAVQDAQNRPVQEIALPPGHPVPLRDGTFHIGISRIATPLQAGASVPMTLHFSKAGDIAVTVTVEKTPSE
jgi:periplasmic copper chaperone A